MNSLRLTIRALLGAAVIGSAPAYALSPTDYAAGNNLDVFFGGATATDNVLENNFLTTTGGICAPGTIDIYRVQVTNRNNRVIYCRVTANQVPGFPASNIVGGVETGGQKVAFHKESIGGSSNGVVPLFNQSNLEFFNMAQAASCTDSGLKNTGSTDLREYREWTACPDNTILRVPNGGISDTEPNLSFPAPTADQIATLTSTPGIGIIFGVPVTLNTYRALQIAQGLPTNDAVTSIPSLSSSQIRGLYTQRISSWDQLRNGSNAPITTLAGVTSPTNAVALAGAADNRVFICRRVNSSGTQASSESYWLQGRCDAKNGSTGALVFAGGQSASMDVGTTPAAQGFNTRVTPGEGSGDVRSCLNAHHTNGTWAIGVLSTEVQDSQTGNWRFVAVDGAAPNMAEVANGNYTFFSENTLNRRATGQTGAPTGLTLTLLQYLEQEIGKPAILSLVNNSFDGRPWGDGGLLTLATAAGATPNAPAQVDGATGAGTMDANPVNTQSRSEVNGKVNNCNPPVMRRASPVL